MSRRWLVVLALSCTGPPDDTGVDADADTDADADADTDTDTDTDTAVGWALAYDFPGFTFHRPGSTVAIVSASPLLIAEGGGGGFDPDFDQPLGALVRVYQVDLGSGSVEATRGMEHPNMATHLSLAKGDFNGDGITDLTSPIGTFIGPLTPPLEEPPHSYTDFAEAVSTCDVNDDGFDDICGYSGVDHGPVDGVPDLTWGPDPGGGGDEPPMGLTVGRYGGSYAAYVPGPPPGPLSRIERVPLAGVGVVDDSTIVTWPVPAGFQLGALATQPGAGADDLLLVCGTTAGVTEMLVFDAFPAPPTVAATFQTPCHALELADYDGDGQLEIAVGLSSEIEIYELDWTLRASHVGSLAPGADGIGASLDSMDVNGDGRADLLAGAPEFGALYLTLAAIPVP